MKELTAIVIGATGLTGNLLVTELLEDPDFKTVRILVRRPTNRSHPRLQERITNFNDPVDLQQQIGEGDIIFCCVGTTQKKVKNDKTAYEKIDFDIPVNAARIGIERNYKKFLIISAIGANDTSANFYLRLKGKTENALKKFPFESLSIFRPSFLIGNRNEYRFGEKILHFFFEIFSFLFIGKWKKYHPVDAENVAIAMWKQSKKKETGIFYFDYSGIMKLVKS